jgi:hypothetical protein
VADTYLWTPAYLSSLYCLTSSIVLEKFLQEHVDKIVEAKQPNLEFGNMLTSAVTPGKSDK